MTDRGEDIGALKAQIADLKSDVAILRVKADERLGAITELRANLANLKTTVGGLQKDRRSIIGAVFAAVLAAIVASVKLTSGGTGQ